MRRSKKTRKKGSKGTRHRENQKKRKEIFLSQRPPKTLEKMMPNKTGLPSIEKGWL